MSGSVLLVLRLELTRGQMEHPETAYDAVISAQLEQLDPQRRVTSITGAVVRASETQWGCGAVTDQRRAGVHENVCRVSAPIRRLEVMSLQIHMALVEHEVPAGHYLRLSLAGEGAGGDVQLGRQDNGSAGQDGHLGGGSRTVNLATAWRVHTGHLDSVLNIPTRTQNSLDGAPAAPALDAVLESGPPTHAASVL